ncbi:hypothetical protein QBC33DRAFT_562175 [Phialemonium atrogriseum]|uniref:Uncharacterized protein n=1 Tax=Phialemonium atrogriseum TaxID=1093897 RepID=A0AAJ0BVE9_9PEZI|nr:uncharacterized protein QBC33DRAFT_562175 [Phialemonium atrogriseum]KAK1764118.1 hypothetical protein QBC33DRAFT_562175 [Phialemonium atrogriseum]
MTARKHTTVSVSVAEKNGVKTETAILTIHSDGDTTADDSSDSSGSGSGLPRLTPDGGLSEYGSNAATDKGANEEQSNDAAKPRGPCVSPETTPPGDTDRQAHHREQVTTTGFGDGPTAHHLTIENLHSELARQSAIRARGHELAAKGQRATFSASARLDAAQEMVEEGRRQTERARRALRRGRQVERRGLSYVRIAEREERRLWRELSSETTAAGRWGAGGEAAVGHDYAAPWAAEVATIPGEVMEVWRERLRRNKA